MTAQELPWINFLRIGNRTFVSLQEFSGKLVINAEVCSFTAHKNDHALAMMRLSLLHVDTLHILESCNPIQQKIAQKNIKPNFKSTVFAEIDPSSISAVISKVEYLDPDFFLLILQETNGKTSNVPFRLICSCGFSPLSSLSLTLISHGYICITLF